MKKTFYIKTLGCKVNRYESQGIATELETAGFRKTGDPAKAGIAIINTCSVTSRADMQSRQEIRKAVKHNPAARVVVTGCYAQTAPETIRQMENVDTVAGHRDKFRIAQALMTSRPIPDPASNVCTDTVFRSFKHTVKGEMTRAYLKIQDGCNAFCTYCIIPYARGRSRSMRPEEVTANLEELARSGYSEAVLTGIHTGAWGLDFPEKPSLFHLLEKITADRPIHRIRISSIEPNEVTDHIIDLAASRPAMCDHFHIPLQSGDDRILKKMERPYDTAYFKERVEKIKQRMPSAKIGTDVMAGFPGEDSRSFKKTLSFIHGLPVDYLHVFPFSPRKGTRAFTYSGRPDPEMTAQRCALLRQLSEKKREQFERGCIGKPVEAVIQHKNHPAPDFFKAVTSNYLFAAVKGDPACQGKVVHILPEKWDKTNKRLVGTINEKTEKTSNERYLHQTG